MTILLLLHRGHQTSLTKRTGWRPGDADAASIANVQTQRSGTAPRLALPVALEDIWDCASQLCRHENRWNHGVSCELLCVETEGRIYQTKHARSLGAQSNRGRAVEFGISQHRF